jgi:hypothetical protein
VRDELRRELPAAAWAALAPGADAELKRAAATAALFAAAKKGDATAIAASAT